MQSEFKSFGAIDFLKGAVFQETERVQVPIKIVADNFSVKSFCFMNLLANFTLVCSCAFRSTISTLSKIYNSNNKVKGVHKKN